MPLVRIDVLRMEPARLAAVGEAVRLALTESIGFPPEDRFQILTNHDGVISTLRVGAYLDVPRDDGIVYIDITMRRGRTDEAKRQMYARVCARLAEQAEVAPHNVFIVVHENADADWSFGYGEAQYVTPARQAFLSRAEVAGLPSAQADPALGRELRELSGTTDDLGPIT